MACFTAPLAEAIIISVVKSIVYKKHKTDELVKTSQNNDSGSITTKLGWLEKMLYGGSFLLAVEHIYHGEIVFYPPFLTAMRSPEEISVMLHEIATVGVGMAVLVTAVWGIAVGISAFMKKRNKKELLGVGF